MKTVSSAFQNHLNSGATSLCNCWRITRKDEAVFGFTDHNKPLQFDASSFEPESGFSAVQISTSGDLAVDAQEVQGVLRSTHITEADILDGRWDNAAVQFWRVNWADTGQRVMLRAGSLGQIRRGKSAFVTEIRALSHFLAQTSGRTFQYKCDAKLGDNRCGVDLTDPAYHGNGVVEVLQRDRAFSCGGLDGFAAALFEAGVLGWQAGANAGRQSIIIGHRVNGALVSLILQDAPINPIAVGDSFIARFHCPGRLRQAYRNLRCQICQPDKLSRMCANARA